MKNSITLSVPRACAEQWSSFTPTSQGGMCGSCKKEVVDFTNMSDQQIMTYFSRSTGSTCGRFHANQLKTYSAVSPMVVKPSWMYLRAGLLGLFLALLPNPSDALPPVSTLPSESYFLGFANVSFRQTLPRPMLRITGKIVSGEDGSPMPGANVAIKGTTLGTVANEKGEFSFDFDLREGDVLVFSFIGYKTIEQTVTATSTSFAIVMHIDIENILGEVVVGQVYAEPPATGFQKWWTKFKNIF